MTKFWVKNNITCILKKDIYCSLAKKQSISQSDSFEKEEITPLKAKEGQTSDWNQASMLIICDKIV